MEDITDFIAADNLPKAIEYVQAVNTSFLKLHDQITHRRASPKLPADIREMPVQGFDGYSLRTVKHQDGRYFMLSAHRPGRSETNKNFRTQRGLRDVDEM